MELRALRNNLIIYILYFNVVINVFSFDNPASDDFQEEFERLISNKTNLEGFVNHQNDSQAKGFQVQEKTQKLNNWLATEGENSLATAIAFDNLAIALRNDAHPDYLASEKNTLKALRILRKIGENNSLDVAICLDNLAGLYSELGNVVDSIPLREKAVEILKKLPDQGGKHLGIALSNLSTNYINLCDYEAAYFYARKSLEIQSGRGQEMSFSSTTTSILGFIEMKKGNLLQAEKYYRQDISNTDRELQKNSAKKYSNSDAAYYVPRLFLAQVLIRQNKLSEAEVILKQVKPYLDNLPPGHQNLANGLRI
jgi:tetratricopeptide (TPR) repeat protein